MIEVYKFGGASLKDEGSIRNMAEILKNSPRPLVVVVSAMGKTTNALEAVAHSYFQKDGHAAALWSAIKADHLAIAEALTDRETALEIINAYDRQFEEFIEKNRSEEFTFVYDQIVSLGELFSSSIIAAYLQQQNLSATWLDVRKIIQTDRAYTEAIVNWRATQTQVSRELTDFDDKLLITQGFLGSTPEGFTSTLGREGSDYSAAVLAFCLNADKLSIWKDVPGVLNADPKQFPDAVLLPAISFHEAIEMSFYGAKVIHPKTIKPLQNKNIPLHVRSFLNPSGEGTLISDMEGEYSLPPVVVYREEQILLSFSVKDFSFIGAENLSLIYQELAKQRLHLNLIHNGAISFSASLDNKPLKIKVLMEALSDEFDILVNDGLELLTIRHYNEETIEKLTAGKEILLQEKTRNTIQVLMRHL